MRRLVTVAAALALLAFAPAAGAAEAVLTGCERATVDSDGAADFEARMDRVSGTARMQVRFRLQARNSKRRWARVPAPGFDEWVTSDPGVARYVYGKRVEGLIAPGAYRVQVRFRWLDAEGHTIESERDNSGVCRQPDPRPNLTLIGLRTTRTGYLAQVANSGRSPAVDFTLALTVGGQPAGTVAVTGVPAHQSRFIPIPGPACAPGGEVVVEADSGQAVAESAEDDNVLARTCPF
jgi:CARDB